MKYYTELPEGIHRGSNLRLLKSNGEGLMVIVALDIVGHGPVSFPVLIGELKTNGWADCDLKYGSHEMQVTLGPNRDAIARHSITFTRRSVTVRRMPEVMA